jgi:hypothetical protein
MDYVTTLMTSHTIEGPTGTSALPVTVDCGAVEIKSVTIKHTRLSDTPGLLQSAKMLVWMKQFNSAIAVLDQAVVKKESVLEARWLRANLLVLKGHFTTARKDLKVLSRRNRRRKAPPYEYNPKREPTGKSSRSYGGSRVELQKEHRKHDKETVNREAEDDNNVGAVDSKPLSTGRANTVAIKALVTSIETAVAAQNAAMTSHAMGRMQVTRV